jgi:hypothetical protein
MKESFGFAGQVAFSTVKFLQKPGYGGSSLYPKSIPLQGIVPVMFA